MFTKISNFLFHAKYQMVWRVAFWLNLALLLYLTLTPTVGLNIEIPHLDKLFHFIGFGSIAFIGQLAYPLIRSLHIILYSSVFGLSVELAQSALPYRTFSVADFLVDIAGIVTAIYFLSLIKHKSSQSNN